ncbi:hypothetical protein [Solidesulfovibrio carbinolicus]|uniref:hypothetical protein n=1 Tax=Solidesulfovibrio carbinolicus TaxID=296842 RepID=UPI00101394FC|nr:hypothetical protein [Solidesulfovibrio carbinolicus]
MATRKIIAWDFLSKEGRHDAAESLALQDHYLDKIADIIASGKNISPKLIATSLRNLIETNIPTEILEYAADLLEGKRRRGRPVTGASLSHTEAIIGFTQSDFEELISQGYNAADAMRKMARDMLPMNDPSEDEIDKMANRISKWVYPRKRKSRGRLPK